MNYENLSLENMPKLVGEMHQDLKELKEALKQPKREKAEQYLTRKEVMEKLKISSYTTIIKLERQNVLKPVRVGKKYLYKQSEVSKIENFL